MPHTPLPWKHECDHNRHWISAGKGRKRIQIADVTDIEIDRGSSDVDDDTETTAANGDLLAAAPELLAACRSLVKAAASQEEEADAMGCRAAVTKAFGS